MVTFAPDQRKDKRVLYPNHTLVHYLLHRGVRWTQVHYLMLYCALYSALSLKEILKKIGI